MIKNRFSNVVWESIADKNDYVIFDDIDSVASYIVCYLVIFHENPIKNSLSVSFSSYSFEVDKDKMKLCSSRGMVCQDISLDKSILTLTYKSKDGNRLVKRYKKSKRKFSEAQKNGNFYSK